ncbi:phosphotransferase [Prosthecobacter sp. SYSU 5D2]|uniref:aminoglycoside phosphotransferase family protein n=1 Tax=Prosthecobacter sp. SYSU 5D2 TaxID=3134134 RepID=UPI0031FE578D
MPPEHEALLILTRQQFPALADLPCVVEPIVKGGSDRHFYRFTWEGESHPPMILMVYTMARRDNPKFVPATRRLAALGVNVPKIFAFDEQRLCVWLEDLGRDDLHAHRDDPWETRRGLYEATLREAAKIHAVKAASLSAADLGSMEPEFNEGLYDWEQNYFMEHFVRNVLRRDADHADHAPARTVLMELRQRLARLPRCLVHRDFQSQNVLLKDGQAWLVDYQGLRPGLAEYDLASLLFDPYVTLSRSERGELLQYYADLRGLALPDLRQVVYQCAAQRLMQALGAYGNLSRNQGKTAFEQHIPAGVRNLSAVCEEAQELAPLRSLFL